MTCHKFQIDGAAAAIRKMLPLIFSREQGAHFGTAASPLWQGGHCILEQPITNVCVVILLSNIGENPCAAYRRPAAS